MSFFMACYGGSSTEVIYVAPRCALFFSDMCFSLPFQLPVEGNLATTDEICVEKKTVLSKNSEPPDKGKVIDDENQLSVAGSDTLAESEYLPHTVPKSPVNTSQEPESLPDDLGQFSDSKENIGVDNIKDNTRNVFDAFPVEKGQSSKQSLNHGAGEETVCNAIIDIEKETPTKSADASSMKLKQARDRHKANKNSDFLSSFESFLKSHHSSGVSSTSNSPPSNCPQNISKEILKTLSRDSKSRDSDTNNRSPDIKATCLTETVKKNLKLKELRISLDSKEVMDHTQSSHSKDREIPSKTMKKNLSSRLTKANERMSEHVSISSSDSLANNVSFVASSIKENVSSEKDQKNDKDNAVLDRASDADKSSAVTIPVSHHVFDSESAKPLKKRGRRGKRFESFDRMNEPENNTEEINLSGKTSDTEYQRVKAFDTVDVSVVKGVVKDAVTQVSATECTKPVSEVKPVQLNVSSSVGEPSVQISSVPVNKRETKGKKTKGRTKCSVAKIKNQKKSETNNVKLSKKSNSVKLTGKCEMEIEKNSDRLRQFKVTRSFLRRTITNTAVLKKYPERSCKLNKLVDEKSLEKKVTPKSNYKPLKRFKTVLKKVLPAANENKTLVNTDDVIKPKKKRKRKVKPWSWGNEKKKYKPKPKLPIVSCAADDVNGKNVETEINDTVLESKADQTHIESVDVLEQNKKSSSETLSSESLKEHGIKLFKRSDVGSNVDSVAESGSVNKQPKKTTTKKSNNRKHSKYKVSNAISDSKDMIESQLDNTEMQILETSADIALYGTDQMAASDKEEKVEKMSENDSLNSSTEQSEIDITASHALILEPTSSKTLRVTSTGNFKRTLKKGKRHKKGKNMSLKGQKSFQDQNLVSSTSCEEILKADTETSVLYDQDTSKVVETALPETALPEAQTSILQVLEDQHVQQESIADPERRLDPVHVSSDSGIESVAGSPVGNESPNSVLSSEPPQSYHSVSNPLVTCSSNSDRSLISDNIFVAISSCVTSACLSSATLVDSLVTNRVSHVGDNSSTSTTNCLSIVTSTSSSNCVQSSHQSNSISCKGNSEMQTILESYKLSKSLKQSDVTKSHEHNIVTVSPSKKKNRAKFLLKHKTSVLLQQGRMPTEEEREHMHEDKFSYLNKHNHGEERENILESNFSYLNKHNHGETLNNTSSVKAPDDKIVYLNDTVLFNLAKDKDTCVYSSNTDSLDNPPVLSETSEHSDKALIENADCTISSHLAKETEPLTCEKESENASYKLEQILTESAILTESEVLTESANSVPKLSEDTVDHLPNLSDNLAAESLTDNGIVSEEFCLEQNYSETDTEPLELSQNSNHCDQSVFTPSIEEELVSEQIHQIDKHLNKLNGPFNLKTFKKRGRPPGKHKKTLVLNVKKKSGRPRKLILNVKRKPGRPKGSKNKKKLQSVINTPFTESENQLKDKVDKTSKTVKPFSENKHLLKVKGGKITKSVKPLSENKNLLKETARRVTKSVGRPKGWRKKQSSMNIGPDSNLEKPSSAENLAFMSMMQWRESKDEVGLEHLDQKKKRGRPRKHPLKNSILTTKKNEVRKKQNENKKKQIERKEFKQLQLKENSRDHHPERSPTLNENEFDITAQTEPVSVESQFYLQKDVQNANDLLVTDVDIGAKKTSPKIRKSKLHLSVRKEKHSKSKDHKGHSRHKSSDLDYIADLGDHDLIQDTSLHSMDNTLSESLEIPKTVGVSTEGYPSLIGGLCPPQSDRSIDSDTSGAGSSLGAISSNFHLMWQYSRHKRKKNKKKLFHFRSKHKNIIDPVFIGEVDYLIREFPHLSISSPGETFLKVRPGEVPLPSIFRVTIINVKKKKKDKLLVFEKSRPLKHKNIYDSEFGMRDKLKLGRRKGIDDNLFDAIGVDLADLEQPHYLPPKKRHKLFSAQENSRTKMPQKSQEKRKVGRPKKVRPPSPSHIFSFGK